MQKISSRTFPKTSHCLISLSFCYNAYWCHHFTKIKVHMSPVIHFIQDKARFTRPGKLLPWIQGPVPILTCHLILFHNRQFLVWVLWSLTKQLHAQQGLMCWVILFLFFSFWLMRSAIYATVALLLAHTCQESPCLFFTSTSLGSPILTVGDFFFFFTFWTATYRYFPQLNLSLPQFDFYKFSDNDDKAFIKFTEILLLLTATSTHQNKVLEAGLAVYTHLLLTCAVAIILATCFLLVTMFLFISV